jgi:predicted GNAT family acetyltransferase
MKELLESGQHCETVARAWPYIKEILFEQHLILFASTEDPDSKQGKGYAQAYRVLEKFQRAGAETIREEEKRRSS